MATTENGIGEEMPFAHSIPVPQRKLADCLANRGEGASKQAPGFLYLDCGRWGGDAGGKFPKQRNFGLVWGRWAALCDFVTEGADLPPRLDQEATKPNPQFAPVNSLLAALTKAGECAVRVLKADYADPSPLAPEPDWNRINIFLPDLHLPLVTSLPDLLDAAEVAAALGRPPRRRSDGPAVGRYQYGGGGGDALSPEALRWFQRYLEGDIFQHAADDLVRFVELLVAARDTLPIRLVQVGDMYDLWIGLDRYFMSERSDAVILVSDPDPAGVSASAFVDHWVERTRTNHTGLFHAIKGLCSSPVEAVWLNGNHDCYLEAYTPPSLTARRRFVCDGGLFAEHGHRGDSSNRDGAIMGQFITNEVFEFPFLRKMDPNRRLAFVGVAAHLALDLLSTTTDQGVCVYVMGHTHSGHLARVQLQPVSTLTDEMNDFFLQTLARSPFAK